MDSQFQVSFSFGLMDVYKEWLGIPEGERPPDHYTLLRLVKFEDDESRIRKNYTKLNGHVRKYATGTYSKQSQELLNELAKAMLCLTDSQRKRDYDLGLGREFDEDTFGAERKEMLLVLVGEGVISKDQAKEAHSFADARGLSMRDAVVQMKLADADTSTRAFAQELGYSYVDLADTIPDDSVLDKVPRNLVKRHSILPLFVDEDVLLVACVHEPTPDLEEEIRLRYGVPMRPVMATPLAVNQAIAKYYAPGARDEAVADEAPAKPTGKAAKKAAKPASNSKAKGKEKADAGSPEEIRQKRMVAILIGCWGVIGSVMLDLFLTQPNHWPSIAGYLFTLILAPIVVGAVYLFVWK